MSKLISFKYVQLFKLEFGQVTAVNVPLSLWKDIFPYLILSLTSPNQRNYITINER